jgi:hypothetical protein
MTHSRSELLTALDRTARGESLALMLFGSVGRGEGRDRSGTDILQMTSRYRPSYKAGGYSFTVYTPESLEGAAVSGSLFVLHLKTEGIVLRDAQGVLARTLGKYVPPASYGPYFDELRRAVNLLNVSGDLYATEWERCHRLALFLLRSTLYAASAERGHPTFSISRLATELEDERIERVYELKYLEAPDSGLYWKCVKLVLEYLHTNFSTPPDSAHSILLDAVGNSALTVAMAQRFLGRGNGGGYGRGE